VSSYNAEARRAAGRLHTMVTPEFTPVHLRSLARPPAMLRVHWVLALGAWLSHDRWHTEHATPPPLSAPE
jgi:hypothetical protein